MKPKISSDKFPNIADESINQAVIKFVSQLGLSGGSVHNVDLYKLLRHYLKNEDVRSQINKVLNDNSCF
jgi:hydrogenase maturation factor HypF (carbamoyltransferase family)